MLKKLHYKKFKYVNIFNILLSIIYILGKGCKMTLMVKLEKQDKQKTHSLIII